MTRISSIIVIIITSIIIISCTNKKEVPEIPMFVKGDTTYVIKMAEHYLDLIKEREYEEAFGMLTEIIDEEPNEFSEEKMTELYNFYSAFPILDYSIEGMEFKNEYNVRLVYKIKFFEKEEGNNIPNTYKITFAPQRLNATWYLEIKK